MELKGLHHISILTANAAKNFEFYTQDIGLRLIKKTVNQDDTSSYHLFYGDERGNAGTELTFFDIPHAAPTRPGISSISSVSLRVRNRETLNYWREHLNELKIEHEGISLRAGRDTLAFRDFEGLHLVLVADGEEKGVPGGTPWEQSPIPQHHGIRGLGPVMLTVNDAERTSRTLTDVMGFREVGQYPSQVSGQPGVLVFATGDGGAGAEVHVEERHDLSTEMLGRGGVHHVAFRVPNSEEHVAWLERLESAGFRTSGLVNRYYFQSIYFRERNGILFELATDGPGFTTDEDFEHLGEKLALPPFLEKQRASIEANLHPLNTTRY